MRLRFRLKADLLLLCIFVVVGLPIVGVVLAESTTWNAIWWIVYVVWGFWLSHREGGSHFVIGTMCFQIPSLVLLETALIDFKLPVLLNGVWAACCFTAMAKRLSALLEQRSLESPLESDEGCNASLR